MTNLFEFIKVFRQIINSPLNSNQVDQCLITGSSYTAKQKKREIKKVLLTSDLNKLTLIEVLKSKIDLILVYNYENWAKTTLIDEKLDIFKHIIEKNITIYKIPDNWVYTKGGLNDNLAEILKLEIEGIFQVKIGEKFLPYGRICSPFKSQVRYSLLLNLISDKLGLKNFQYVLVNNADDVVKKCVLLVGKNAEPEWLKRIKIKDINLFLGNGLNYNLARLAESLEINFIDVTYESICVGLSRLSKVLSIKIPDIEFIDVFSPLPLFFFSR